MLMAPPVDSFLRERAGLSAYAITDLDGAPVQGELWLSGQRPSGREPAFHSEVVDGVNYRIVVQRLPTAAGEMVMLLADGSDPRQHWAQSVLLRVLLPNVLLALLAAFAVNWAVRLALRPLLAVKEAVARRSPRDLSALDVQASPEEVRPLVQSLNRLFALVQAQQEAQRRFVADAAHQLRTPLAALQAQVEALGAAVANPAGVSALDAASLRASQIDKLRGAMRRTTHLANQLLALSRVDASELDAEPVQPLDLKDLCQAQLEVHFDAALAKCLDLGLEAPSTPALGHAWLLGELLGNLLDNAVKYTPVDGRVTVRCGVADGCPFLEVEDDGPGIDPVLRDRVLERFYRVAGSGTEGNGLGLAIAQEIAHRHAGTLCLRTGAQGRGLCVRLVLGAVRESSAPNPRTP
jgi:two-component system sensor histidine kinase TctE